MADDTKLIISLELILKNLDRTLKGLSQVEKQLKSVANIKLTSTVNANFDKATVAAQKLTLQQNKLAVQAQELANRQERARQTTERLALAQDRLAASSARQANASQQAATQVARIEANTARQAAQQEALRTRAAKTISDVQVREAQRGADALVNSLQKQIQKSEQFQKTLGAVGNSLRSIGQGLSTLGIGLTAALTAPLVALGTTSVRAAVSLDSLKRGLTAIVGSSEEASRQLARLTELAKLPGIGFEEAIQGSIRLQAVGFSAAEAEKSLKQFANAIALTGGGRAELERVTIQLGQLAAKGKVLSQDLRPIIEAAPAVGRALLQAFGTVNADDIQQLGLSSKEFLGVLTTQLEQLPRAAAGARNAFENFRDTVFRASAAIGDALLPVLSRLIEVAAPIITRLAEGFQKLDPVIQNIVVVLSGFAAALGPVLFVFGQLTTGIGRLIVGFVQLSAAGGIGAVVKQLQALAAGAATAAEAETALAAANSLVTVSMAGLGLAIGAIIAIYLAFNTAQADAVEVSKEQLAATQSQIDALQSQLKFLNGLKQGVKLTADEQSRLVGVYEQLNAAAQARVGGISDETKRLAEIREEIQKLLALRQQERDQQTAGLVAQLANTQLEIDAANRRRESIANLIQANTALIERIQKTGQVTADMTEALRAQNITGADAAQTVEALRRRSELLAQVQIGLLKLIAGPDGLNTKVETLAETLKGLGVVNIEQARTFLTMAKNMGLFNQDIPLVIEELKRFIETTDAATTSNNAFIKSLAEADKFLIESGKAADDLQKQRRLLISSAGAEAREASNSLQGALKFFEAFRKANPNLEAALKREAQITGKSIQTLIDESIGATKKASDSLVEQQERLADASARVVQEAKEKEIAETKAKNDQLQRLNEQRFSRELISFREFVVERARLQREDVQGEIDRQKKVIELANQDIERARQAASTGTGKNQIRAQIDEQQSIAKRTAAETKIIELQSKQRQIFADTANDLQQFSQERLQRFKDLENELNVIIGKEGEAERAAVSKRFADDLRELRNEMKLAGQAFIAAQAAGDKAAESNAIASLEQIQGQITSIENHKRELNALIEVREAQEEIRKAEEAQGNLERQLTVDVEFRGKTEEQAIEERLAGEAKVKAAIEAQQVRLEILAKTLKAAGLEVPLALQEAVERLRVASQGLGELSFSQQFALAEKEFTRLQNDLADKISDVERRIRSRDIAEVQGAIIIRRLNGEKVEALEKQLAILEDIAQRSNDINLQQQAAQARQTTEDVKAQARAVDNLNQQLRSVSIDALNDSLGQFFRDLADNTQSAAEDIANFFKNILAQVNDFVSRNLAREITESLFPDPNAPGKGGGIVGFFKRILGIGDQAQSTQVTQANTTATDANTAQLEQLNLNLGGQAASAPVPVGTGGIVADIAGLFGKVLPAGAQQVIGAVTPQITGNSIPELLKGISDQLAAITRILVSLSGATIAGIGVTQAASPGGSLADFLGNLIGGAAIGDIVSAEPRGKVIRVAEAGFDEAVLTTDPRHAVRQVGILREYLKRTKGLFGRVPEFATGGMISARQAEANLLNSLSASRSPSPARVSPQLVAQSSPATAPVNLRNINLINKREMVQGYLRSAEGAIDIVNIISENGPDIGRRLGVR